MHDRRLHRLAIGLWQMRVWQTSAQFGMRGAARRRCALVICCLRTRRRAGDQVAMGVVERVMRPAPPYSARLSRPDVGE